MLRQNMREQFGSVNDTCKQLSMLLPSSVLSAAPTLSDIKPFLTMYRSLLPEHWDISVKAEHSLWKDHWKRNKSNVPLLLLLVLSMLMDCLLLLFFYLCWLSFLLPVVNLSAHCPH